jgi:hypothetical protein
MASNKGEVPMTDVETAPWFPRQPSEVTPEWLTERLRQGGAIGHDDRVIDFTSTPLGEGAGMLGVLARLELRCEQEPPAVPSVVVKWATPVEGNRAVAMTFRMYEREVRFFRELASRVTAGVPACYEAEIELPGGDFVLVLEDLVGYREGDQAAGCNVDDAQLGIDVMARLHSTWWDAAGHPELEWVPTVDGDLHRGGMVPAAAASWEPFVANFRHLLPQEIVDSAPRYLDALDGLHHRMGEGPQTLIHGDFRLDNLLFGTRPGHHPLMLIDWQGVIVSKGAHDLAYLVSQNLVTDARREHERDLVQRYVQQLGAAGVTGYSAEQCWDDYRLASLWLFEYGIIIGGALDPSNERGTAFMTGLVERSVATIMDLDLLELLP